MTVKKVYTPILRVHLADKHLFPSDRKHQVSFVCGVLLAHGSWLSQVRRVVASQSAFAAVCGDGRVATWGHEDFGGDSSAVDHQLAPVWQILG